MKIQFNLSTAIEVPDADECPPLEEIERQFIEFFKEEGMIASGLEVKDFCVSKGKGEA